MFQAAPLASRSLSELTTCKFLRADHCTSSSTTVNGPGIVIWRWLVNRTLTETVWAEKFILGSLTCNARSRLTSSRGFVNGDCAAACAAVLFTVISFDQSCITPDSPLIHTE